MGAVEKLMEMGAAVMMFLLAVSMLLAWTGEYQKAFNQVIKDSDRQFVVMVER